MPNNDVCVSFYDNAHQFLLPCMYRCPWEMPIMYFSFLYSLYSMSVVYTCILPLNEFLNLKSAYSTH